MRAIVVTALALVAATALAQTGSDTAAPVPTPAPPVVTPPPVTSPPATPAPPVSTPSPPVATPSPPAATPSPPAATPSPPAATPSPPGATPSPPAPNTPSPSVPTGPITPAPIPFVPATPAPGTPNDQTTPAPPSSGMSDTTKIVIIVAVSVVGGIFLAAAIALLIVWVRGKGKRDKMLRDREETALERRRREMASSGASPDMANYNFPEAIVVSDPANYPPPYASPHQQMGGVSPQYPQPYQMHPYGGGAVDANGMPLQNSPHNYGTGYPPPYPYQGSQSGAAPAVNNNGVASPLGPGSPNALSQTATGAHAATMHSTDPDDKLGGGRPQSPFG